MKKYLWIMCFIGLVLAMNGCQKGGLKGLVPAEGVVTFNGEPVEGALVTFGPKATSGEAAGAQTTTNDKGNFRMMTLLPNDGVYPGEYYVTVTKNVYEGGISLEEAKKNMENPDSARNNSKTKPKEQTVTWNLPKKYGDIASSGLDISIPKEGMKNIEFKLEGSVDGKAEKITGPSGGRNRR